MERKRKIVLIGPVYPYKGGIAHYTSLLYRALAKKHDVEMISYKMQYPKLLFRKEQKDFSNDMFRINDAKFLIHTANPFNIINVGRKIKKKRPDMVVIQWWHPYFAPCYWLLEKSIGKEIEKVFICHNVFPHERFPMDRFLTKLVLKNGDAFIVHSKSDGEDLLTIKPNAKFKQNPHPTYNAFKIRNITKEQARQELHISSEERLLLFFGFVREYKGLKYLLYAMPKIRKQVDHVKLLVVGSFGDDKEDYMQIIRDNQIEELVEVIDGYIPNNEVEKYFSACDLVVLPYESATQSGIVQIAYGFEKPVVVTNVGGLPDVVQNKRTGYIVEPQNPERIADAVIDFYDKDRGQKFEAYIEEEAYRFSWERMEETIRKISDN